MRIFLGIFVLCVLFSLPVMAQGQQYIPPTQQQIDACVAISNSAGATYAVRSAICYYLNGTSDDAKTSCDTAWKDYNEAKKESRKSQREKSEDSLDRDRTFAERLSQLKQELADLQQEQTDAKTEYDELVIQLQQEIDQLQQDGDSELADLVRESQDLLADYERNLGPERKALYDQYDRDVKNLYSTCKTNAEKQVIDLVSQDRAVQQAQSRGQIQSQSVGGSIGRESRTQRIRRIVERDYLVCLQEKNSLDSSLKTAIEEKDIAAKKINQDIQSKRQEIDKKIESLDKNTRAKIQQMNNARVAAENKIQSISQKIAAKQQEIQMAQQEPLKQQRLEFQGSLDDVIDVEDSKVTAYSNCCDSTAKKKKSENSAASASFCSDRKNGKTRRADR